MKGIGLMLEQGSEGVEADWQSPMPRMVRDMTGHHAQSFYR